MKKFTHAACLLVASGFGASALAADFSYTYADLSYATTEIGGTTFDGPALSGSYGFSENLALTAGVGTLSGGGLRVNLMSLGLDYHMPLGESTDLVASVAAVRSKAKAGGVSATDNSVGYGVAVRNQLAETVELDLGLSRNSDGGATTWNAGINLDVSPQVQLGLGVARNSGDNLYNIGARYNF